ncbi:MAG: 2-dehydro-3-deoxygalactonokinase [Pikeienuella sp.]
MPEPSFAAADWGTSSFRLWLLSAEGAALAERRGAEGMSTLKPDAFDGVLEAHLAALGAAPDLPVVICGMAGAAQGWRPAPYIDLPAALDALETHAVPAPSASGRDVRILPGLAERREGREDVMRGEETILLGARARGVDGLVCMPGTHSKWVRIEGGAVAAFSTAMTGEVFALLRRHSTLSHFLGGEAEDEAAFAEAAEAALTRPEALLNHLFTVRARPLLSPGEAASMPSRLSGLLIGTEIAAMRGQAAAGLTLISGGALARRYARALEIAGLPHHQIESDELVRAGLHQAGRRLWPQGT